MEPRAIVWTEGKTDWRHLKRAAQALKLTTFSFHENDEDFGDDQLLKQCQALARVPQRLPTIFVFDRDNDAMIARAEGPSQGYKVWGNNVFSLVLPVPSHRQTCSRFCLEHYYTDDLLMVADTSGRRLFLASEFNRDSGRHASAPTLSIGRKNALPNPDSASAPRIIDAEVFNERSENVALSKFAFAELAISGAAPFEDEAFEGFRPLFAQLAAIVEGAQPKIDLAFADLQVFQARLGELSQPLRLAASVDAVIRILKLAASVFAASVIRHYEKRIVESGRGDVKKVGPIKHLLGGSFGQPTLGSLQRLARYAYHLVDENAPSAILDLRSMMASSPTLGPIGELLDELERIFPPARDEVRIINKRVLKKPLLEFVLVEFAKYEGRLGQVNDEAIAKLSPGMNVDDLCRESLEATIRCVAILRTLPLRTRRIERVRNDSDEFEVALTTFRDGRAVTSALTQTFQDLRDDRLTSHELVVGTESVDESLDLFPFVAISDERLHFYVRTRSQGYEFAQVFGTTGYLFPTKRKFSHVALRSAFVTDLQAMFWAPVLPTVSDAGVRANFPLQDAIVGRQQQLTTILDEVIEIPNQNGLIYGPGGVGKTALLIELSRQLFESQGQVPVFRNIIWVSAKRDFYDPTLDMVEAGQPQFRTLDNVLGAILEFHGFEDASGYGLDDKKWLVLELVREETTLLVLDNFESVAPQGQSEIVRFFGVDVKKALKGTPGQFKVLVTSRELIPSGFHQIRLKGLDKRDSKLLMQRLYEPYRHSETPPLTDDQQDEVYEKTQGIPIIIKHCFAQYYEHNRPLSSALNGLHAAGNRVVEFSFSELLEILREDELFLKIILLLEVSGRPLMPRQMADILGVIEDDVTDRVVRLVNLQCLQRRSVGPDDKFTLHDEVKFLVSRLAQSEVAVASAIKQQIAGLAMEKRMDYTAGESEAAVLFQDYLAQGHYVQGEDFIRERLKEYPSSILLNLHYARFLKDVKKRTEDAIATLESIRERSGNDQQILRLLMTYYSELDTPSFDQANSYARELEELASQDEEMGLELAAFYVRWSTALKMCVQLDPLKEMLRQQKYKELAEAAISHLERQSKQTHQVMHLLAQSYYNKWDYEKALACIEDGLSLLPRGSHLDAPYRHLRSEILRRRDYGKRIKASYR